jgi:NitT/TauT family transport system permease protein
MTAKVLPQAGSILSLVVLWQVIATLRPDWAFFIGSPLGILEALSDPPILARLPGDVLITSWQAISGFLLGVGAGTLVGLGLWLSRAAFTIARPYLIFIASVPIFALGPVFVFWFGTEFGSKLALVVVATFSIAVLQAYQGAQECDGNLLRLAVAFRATKRQILWGLVAPSAVTWVLAGVRINISMALVGSVVGELISSRRGVGNLLLVAEGLYNINLLLGGVLLIGLVAIILNWAISPIERWGRKFNPRAGASPFETPPIVGGPFNK